MTSCATRLSFLGLALLGSLLSLQTAAAKIIGTAGLMEVIPPPASVVNNALTNDDTLYVFEEQQGVTLSDELVVNVVVPGRYGPNFPPPDLDTGLTQGSIPSGTSVNSHFLHGDGDVGSPTVRLSGSVTFDQDILGVIFQTNQLNLTHRLLGATDTDYHTGSSAWFNIFGTDSFVLSEDRRTLTMDPASIGNGSDNIRVVTAVVDPCDFDADGSLGLGDVNMLLAAIKSGQNEAKFDVTGDDFVNHDDIKFFIRDESKLHTWFGDANLDSEFNSGDFVEVFQSDKFETGEVAGWSEGDWNADGVFNSSDFIAAFQDGGYEKGKRAEVAAVPEPSGWILMTLGLIGIPRIQRKR